MTDPTAIPGERVCSFIERIERIDEEIKALNEGKKEATAQYSKEARADKRRRICSSVRNWHSKSPGTAGSDFSDGHCERNA